MSGILGIHHMTAISGPAQENVDFYAGILGLRLVKKTVNFDDPNAYHLYYGDGIGTPGSIITFFPYPDGYKSRPGAGQVIATSLSIPVGSMSYWIDRFAAEAVPFEMPTERNDAQIMSFIAPDGLQLELVGDPQYQAPAAMAEGPVPVGHAISGIHSVTLLEKNPEFTDETLVSHLGFTRSPDDDDIFVMYRSGEGPRSRVDVRCESHASLGRGGHGSVHHIAFRIATAEEQVDLRESLVEAGYFVSQVLDRTYFQSIYFREPGGVLFEVATDAPGFLVDEELNELGTHLRLPGQHEHLRAQLEASLPPLVVPQWSR